MANWTIYDDEPTPEPYEEEVKAEKVGNAFASWIGWTGDAFVNEGVEDYYWKFD